MKEKQIAKIIFYDREMMKYSTIIIGYCIMTDIIASSILDKKNGRREDQNIINYSLFIRIIFYRLVWESTASLEMMTKNQLKLFRF